ncbi:hypothetical protein, partial [Mycolicibacterium poriferae]|uniref:hypothetical protein n=1 Tax=Mycolicibacterium poriferae TaxID=39694 RepID=UPI0024BAED5A
EIESSTDRFDQHVVKVPAPPIGAHGSNTALPEFNSKERPKLTPPMPIRLGSHVVHTLVDRVFSFAQ